MADVLDGIIVGGAGGLIAGFTLGGAQLLRTEFLIYRDKKRLYKWLQENTEEKAGERFRSTKAISSWNNLTEDRVRYICSLHKKIFMSTGDKDDIWGIYEHDVRSVYEERGMIDV